MHRGYANDWRGYYEQVARTVPHTGGNQVGVLEQGRHCGKINTVGVSMITNKRCTSVRGLIVARERGRDVPSVLDIQSE
jgi:hypothetical protein